MERKGLKENSKDLCLYTHRVQDKEMNFLKACFHLVHEEQWKKTTKVLAEQPMNENEQQGGEHHNNNQEDSRWKRSRFYSP